MKKTYIGIAQKYAAVVSRIIKPEQRKNITLKYVVSENYKLFPVKTVTAVTGA